MYEAIQEQLKACVDYVAEQGHLKPGAAVVLGCSTSEVAGGHIGKNSVPELGDALAEAMISACKARGLNPVFQCCEHLNRALVVEEACAEAHDLEIVNAIPWAHGGGAMGTTAYSRFEHPVVVSHVKASAGMDIGGTLIGMHLKEVAVPVRVSVDHIGNAILLLARTHPRFVGGERARYNPELL